MPAQRGAQPPSRCRPPCLAQAFAGIVTVSVGHCHPEVVKAVNEQNQLLQHTTTIYLNNQIAEYAKELADRMPGNLKVGRGGARARWGALCAHTPTHAWHIGSARRQRRTRAARGRRSSAASRRPGAP